MKHLPVAAVDHRENLVEEGCVAEPGVRPREVDPALPRDVVDRVGPAERLVRQWMRSGSKLLNEEAFSIATVRRQTPLPTIVTPAAPTPAISAATM